MNRLRLVAGRGVNCWCALTLLALAVGCGSGNSATTVQGKITFQGKPVTFGLINFMAAGGKPLGGEIQTDGSYEYELPPGDYQVRIDAPPKMPEGYKEGDPMPKLGPRLAPAKYANFATSGLTLSVGDESPQQHDFSLQ